MYTLNLLIEGDAPILHHAFSPSVRLECSVIGPPETSKSPASGIGRGKEFMNTFSTSTQRGVSAAVRLHAGDPDLVACDMIIVAYRFLGYRQVRHEHKERFEALLGALTDVTMFRLRDQVTADGGPAVAMLDTVPSDGLIKLTVIENCEMTLCRWKTNRWQTALADWLTTRQAAGIRQRSIMVCGWRLEHEVAQAAAIATQFGGDPSTSSGQAVVIAGRWCAPVEWFLER